MRCILLFLFILIVNNAIAQSTLLDSLIRQNSYPIQYTNGALSGAGMDFILQKTRNAQFVNLCEEHNAKEIPIFTTALFTALQKNNGFKYLALEQDPLRMHTLADSKYPYKGSMDSAFSLLKQYPYSYTFRTDQEVAMIADIAKLSTAKSRPVWGCDQAYGAMHYLQELIKLAPNENAKKYTHSLMDSVWQHERDIEGSWHYMSQRSDYDKINHLSEIYKPLEGSFAAWLIHSLESSVRIYQMLRFNKFNQYPYGGRYNNNVTREDYMKERFLEEYNLALKKEKKLPKVISKFGHWHLMNGFGPGNALTLGTFLRDLARFNKMDCFTIDLSMLGKLGTQYYNWFMKNDIMKLFAQSLNTPDGWAIVDLTVLRYYASRLIAKGYISADLEERFIRFTNLYDAVIVFGNGEQGTYDWKK